MSSTSCRGRRAVATKALTVLSGLGAALLLVPQLAQPSQAAPAEPGPPSTVFTFVGRLFNLSGGA